MRTFYLTFAVWKDPFWRANFRRSWKNRRYWLAKPTYPHIKGRATCLQFGPWSFTITALGAGNQLGDTTGQPQPTRRNPHG